MNQFQESKFPVGGFELTDKEKEARRHYHAGNGYKSLNMPQEALAEYQSVRQDSTIYRDAAMEIIWLLISMRLFERAVRAGLEYMQNHNYHYSMAEATAIAMHLGGRFTEALELMRDHPMWFDPSTKIGCYAFGTTAARCGEWDQADMAFFTYMNLPTMNPTRGFFWTSMSNSGWQV